MDEVISEDQRDLPGADELFPQDECLRETIRFLLNLV